MPGAISKLVSSEITCPCSSSSDWLIGITCMVLLVSLYHQKSHVLVLTLWLVDRNHMNDTISKPVLLESHDFVYWLQTWPYKHLMSWWCHLHSIYFIFCCLCGFVCDCLDWNWGLWIIIWFSMVWPCYREIFVGVNFTKLWQCDKWRSRLVPSSEGRLY